MATGFVWVRRPTAAIQQGYRRWWYSVEDELEGLVQQFAPQVTAWMKANAPWTDRTGNARRSLVAEALRMRITTIVLELRYGERGGEIEYAKSLEYNYGGRYAIIGPAIDHFLPLIMNAVRAILNKPRMVATVTRGRAS